MKLEKISRIVRIVAVCALIVVTPIIDGAAQVPDQKAQAETEQANTGSPFDVVGHIGGRAQAIIIDDHFAYLGFGPELVIFDIDSPANPVRLGAILLFQVISDIEVSFPYAYVAMYNSGFQIVNIADRAAPFLVGGLTNIGTVNALGIKGNYLYVGGYNQQFQIYDVTKPAAPNQIGALNIFIKDIQIIGNYAYVSEGLILTTIDLANPAAPAILRQYNGFYYAEKITVIPPLIYLTGANDVLIMNISDPVNPFIVGGLGTAYQSQDILIQGNYAYVLSDSTIGQKQNSMVIIVDLAHFMEVKSNLAISGEALRLAKFGSYLFITNGGYGGFSVVNISKPTAPKLAHLDLTPGDLTDMDIAGNTLYATGRIAGLRVLNISNPASPTVTGFVDLPDEVEQVAVNGSYAYVSMYDTGLSVINVANPAAPFRCGKDETLGETQGIASAGSYVYIGARNNFVVESVANPCAPATIGYLAMPANRAAKVLLLNQYALLATGYGVEIVNVANPFFPSSIAKFEHGAISTSALALKDHYLYSAIREAYAGYFRVYDIANINAPVETATNIALPVSGLAVDGSTLLATTDYGLVLLDLHDPLNPVEIGRNNALVYAKDVAVANGYIYLADAESGLFVLRTLPASIQGRAFDIRRRPAAGIPLSLNTGATAVTGADGGYLFNDLEPGKYTITYQNDAYELDPPTRQVPVPPEAAGQDFVVKPKRQQTFIHPGESATLSFTDLHGRVTEVQIPVGAVSDTVQVYLIPIGATGWPGHVAAGQGFHLLVEQNAFEMPDFVFNQPVTLTIGYSASDLFGVMDESQIGLWRFNPFTWEVATSTCEPAGSPVLDLNNRIYSLPICMAGQYGLFGPTLQSYLPNLLR
jgi:hypothetical protein